MKRCSALFVVLVMSGSPIAAQTPNSTSPQPAPPVIAPAPGRPSSQAQNPTAASRPGVTASGLGPIVATGDSVAYVSAESAGHPVVFIGSDPSPYGIVGTLTNHPLGFRTNNIARMFIDTSGNVGVGTSTPAYKLDVNGAINGTSLFVNGVAVGAGGSQWVSGAGGAISYAGGNVGVGTNAPQMALQIQSTTLDRHLYMSSAAPSIHLGNDPVPGSATATAVWGLATADGHFGVKAGDIMFGTYGDSRGDIYIDSNYCCGAGLPRNVILQPTGGNVGIGPASSLYRFNVTASSLIAVHAMSQGATAIEGESTNNAGVLGVSTNGNGIIGQSANGYAGYFFGNVSVSGTVCSSNISCNSDARLKQDIRPLSYGLHEVLQLRPMRWQWKDTSTTQLNIGLIAQDVEPVLPELILRNVDTQGSLGLHYTGLIPILINAIQEQQDTITALKAENMSLDARIRALEQVLERWRPEQ